ncbi:helix-turn-helix domain-containing protein [Streptomyces sp. NPDC048172]|uniref:helix-turn-helix domain-containing protein n=1 Tax=Streptomyces sp. NPDC048172 TaxID=3365505 RepID=UPI00371EC36F
MPTAPVADELPGGPTTRKRLVGIRLRALRERQGLSTEQAGELAGVSKATVSRYERGKGTIKWPVVDQLCRASKAPDSMREDLVALTKSSQDTHGWWVPYADQLSDQMLLLLSLEYEAARISHFSLGVVPGLLQTLDYARSIAPTPEGALPQSEVEDFLSIRMQRPAEVLDRASPPAFHVVLDEAVLRRSTGSPEVMAAQLDHLLERGREPNITIQVLPFDRGSYSAALNTFVVYGGADPELDVVFLENQAGSLFLEAEAAREKYSNTFSFLRQEALDARKSAQMIAEARKTHLQRHT